MSTKIDIRQAISRDTLTRTTGVAGSQVDDVLRALDKEITPPLALSANSPTSLVVNIGGISVVNPDTSLNNTLAPIAGALPTFASGTVTFPSSSGGNAVPSVGSSVAITVSSGNFIKVLLSLDTSGNIVITPGTQASSVAAATLPHASGDVFEIGYVLLTNSGGTIQNITSSNIFQFKHSVGNVTPTGTQTLSNKTQQTLVGAVVTDSTTTGASASLQAGDITNAVVRLTNGSLTSVSGIPAGGSGQLLVVENQTGNSINVSDEDTGVTAANRIRTGTGALVAMPANSTFIFTYDTTASRWMLTGGSGSGSGSGEKNYVSLSTSTAAGWLTPITGNTIAATTDTTAADLPRAQTTKTGWKLTPSGTSFALTSISNATPAVFTLAGHGLREGLIITLTTSGSLPTGLTTATAYYVHVINSSTFNVSTSMKNLLAGTYVATSSAGSGTHTATFGFGELQFTLDAADYNKKLKVQFDQNILSGAAGDWEVDVYSNTASDYSGTYTRLSLSTDDSTSGESILPNFEGTYRTTFDAPGSTAQYIEVRLQRASANTHALVGSDLVVGPGVVQQGAAVSEWQTYTPVFSAGFGTVTNIAGWYRRVGSQMELNIYGTTGTVAGSVATVSIPTGFTVNTSVIHSAAGAGESTNVGTATTVTGTALASVLVNNNTSANVLGFGGDGTDTNTFQNANLVFGTSKNFSIVAKIPINEWAGSGTVNVVQNDVEYAFNTSVTDANDTTSFGYGPAGTSLPGSAFTATRDKRVQFITPISSTDIVTLEVDVDGTGQWATIDAFSDGMIVANNTSPLTNQNGVVYGVGLTNLTSTQASVRFGQYSYASGATYGAVGNAWSGTSAVGKWRLKKAKGGQAVGFGIVQPGTSAGLVSAAGLPGNTTLASNTVSSSVATGYVGEVLSNSQNSSQPLTNGTALQLATITLTPGTWAVSAAFYERIQYSGAPTVASFAGGTSATGGNSFPGDANDPFNFTRVEFAPQDGITGEIQLSVSTVYVTVTTSTPYFLNVVSSWTGGTTVTVGARGKIMAQRIA